jgi:hypothetical protein
MIRIISCLLLLSFFAFPVYGIDKSNKTKYREAKKIDFESLLIEGQKKKPDYSVVTGNLGEKDLGLLKLRTDFIDSIGDDAGEEVTK